MDIEYIIVQTGGLGTRLGKLTHNRPKSIVPVKNLPIIFHLFNKYPDKRFIVIGDYKYDVLEKYLRTFAKAEYMLIKAEGKGNGCGVSDALRFIPEDMPFMLIWSDLILSDDFEIPQNIEGCAVGVTDVFPCSWGFEDGKLIKQPSSENGVGGCFIFDSKSRLEGFPKEGSLTSWLEESDIPLQALSLGGSVEAGTVDALKQIDPGNNRCRPYNHMEFSGEKVIKTGITEEGKKLIDREERWYQKVSEYGFTGIPKIYSFSPLTMERIHGDNIFHATLDDEQKKSTIDQLVDTLETLHSYEAAKVDYFGLQEDYYTKTIKRIDSIRESIPFTNDPYILINGNKCRNVFFFEKELESDVRTYLFEAEFGPIHGDCTLTNTMIDDKGRIYYIDARGYFGKREIFGDVYYDWAKLYYSINGCFDQFNVKNFDLDISDDRVDYKIGESGWEHLTGYFLSRIKDVDLGRIKLIHAIVWLSLASHCWEDYDSMCLAFYNGLSLWDEWIREYRR